MVRHGGSSAGSYLADPTSPIPSHCASIVVTSTVRVKQHSTEIHFFSSCILMFVFSRMSLLCPVLTCLCLHPYIVHSLVLWAIHC